jgi:hypothetical protein
LDLKNSSKPNGVKIIGLMGSAEFKQLNGELNNLCVFATEAISEPTTIKKTGARHSYASYFLFPVKMRRQFKIEDYDFDKLRCGKVEYKDRLYVVYGVPKKYPTAAPEREESGQ